MEINDTAKWMLGAIIIPIVAAIIQRIRTKRKNQAPSAMLPPTSTNSNTINVSNNFLGTSLQNNISGAPIAENDQKKDESWIKANTHILFIDDDAKFKVVTILKKSGWINTKNIKDIDNLDNKLIQETDIFFVDIQGVGLSLQFNDEGLGLALALKKKYPTKRVVIYSAETKGDRFHEALRKADSFLPKNAEPYEFQLLVEEYSGLLS
jgi:hypothetical protein